MRDGKRLVTDGPFAETREQLGGYFLIEAKDLDEAIGIAARIPVARRGTIEIRPVVELTGLPAVERGTSTGRHTQGRVHPDVGRQAQTVGRQRPSLRGLGDLPPKGSPADPNRLYASQSSGWFGQLIQRSNDGGKTWEPVGNKFVYDGVPGTHQWYDGTPHPWEFKRVWHLEPSLTDPDTVYAGVEDAALFRSTDGGQDVAGTLRAARPRLGPPLAAGRRRACACTRSFWIRAIPSGSSSPSRPRALSAPTTPARRGSRSTAACRSEYIPDPTAEVGHCVHRIAMHPSRPNVLFMQKHWDVMRSDDAGESWHEVSGNLPTDFGFVIDVHAHEPETIYVVPIKSDSEHFPPEGKLRVYRSRTGGNEWEALTKGLPQSDCYVNVLRDAMAVDSLDSCGVYFGTTGGQVYASADAGDTWAPIVRDLPAVLSVEVQTLP